MKKVKSFIAIILLFSILFCLPISKAAAATGRYITIVDRAGWTQTITTQGYTTTVTKPGRFYYVLYNYSSLSSVWIMTTVMHLWHPATTKQVRHQAVTHRQWVANGVH
jgi:hypothetical protein